MSINEEELKKWIEQVTKKLSRLEANQTAIINGDFQSKDQPAEPLFTKEVAQMFRLWAEINELSVVSCMYICDGTACFIGRKAIDKRDVMIDIPRTYMSDRITVGTEYAIPELCGEEEE